MFDDWDAYLREAECHLALACAPLYQGGGWSHFLLAFKNFPILLSIVMMLSQFYEPFRDMYYPLGITSGVIVNTCVNALLRLAFTQGSPAGALCATANEMPNWAVQQGFFLTTIIITFPALWRARFGVYQAQFVFFLLWVSSASRIYLGYNTPDQILVAALVGTLVGVLWQLFVYWLLCVTATVRAQRKFSVFLLKSVTYSNSWCKESYTHFTSATDPSERRGVITFRDAVVWLLTLPTILIPPAPDLPSRKHMPDAFDDDMRAPGEFPLPPPPKPPAALRNVVVPTTPLYSGDLLLG